MTAGGIASLVVGVLLATVIIVVIIITILRLTRQRVSVANGRISSTDGVWRPSNIDVADVGAALFIPPKDGGQMNQFGVFDYGGIILLDRSLRLVRVVQHYAGSKLDLRPIFDELQVPRKEDYARKSRRDLLREFPGAAGFWQLRGQLFWGISISLIVIVPILLIVPVAFVSILVGALFGN